MSHAKALLTLGAAALLAVAAACSSSLEADSLGASSSGSPSSSGTSGDNPTPSGSSSSGAFPGPTATGVLLLHAAAFPPFRLCFENLPGMTPQPDSTVMPEANVVGVEIGSLVRIDPLEAPGKVYVIRESTVRSAPGDTTAKSCGELIGDPDSGTLGKLTLDIDYQVATEITEPLGKANPTVLAIAGCGSLALLNSLGLSKDGCGAGWTETSGNLQAKVVDLKPARPTDADQLPVQLFLMSSQLDALGGSSGTLDVTFGDLGKDAGLLDQSVQVGQLFAGGPQTTLTLDQSGDATIYGTHGFRITSGAFSVDQSLAAVQELSSPRELPTDYYRAASNYALLLLGDPTHTPTLTDGGANPSYNPRQAVHLLAVPVIDPTKVDAGADGGGGDGGDGGT